MKDLKINKGNDMAKKIDKKILMQIRKTKSLAELEAFMQRFYEQAFKDGANADVDPNINYVAIKKGVKYECGCCGAELILDEREVEDE